MADRRRVPGGTDQDVGAFVRRFSGHFRKHAVMADDQRQPGTVWALTHRDAEVARLPRFHRHPGMQLAVVELDLALVVDDQSAVEGVAIRVELHDGEATPDPVLDAGALERGDLRSV